MRILVDIRHLSDRHKTGVGEYTSALLRALFAIDRENAYELLTTGARRPLLNLPSPEGRERWVPPTSSSPSSSKEGLRGGLWSHTHRHIPNKLLKLATYLTNRPRLDRLATAQPDLVWLPNLNFSPLSPSVPYVLTLHDLSFKIFPEYFSARMRLWHRGTRPARLARGAAAIIVPSTATKEDVTRFFDVPAARVHVIPHGVDPMFSPAFTPQDHGVRGKHRLPKRFALFVGTLEPRKNVVALVDAVESYRQKTGDDLHLVLAGTWGWKSGAIRKRLEALGREAERHTPHGLKPKASRPIPWLHHLGYVPRADLPAIYRAATVFAWPSAYEGFGLPVLEAMASGTPVITSHTSSLPELTGDAAILVNPFRPDEITLALEQLLSSPSLQARLKAAGLRRASQFSWNRSALETLETFNKIPRGERGA